MASIGFVAWVVPVRDRCEDPLARSGSTRVAVTRTAEACVLHARSGDVAIPLEQCARLRCEPGLATALGGARRGVVAALFAAYFVGAIAWAVRWRMLLAFAGVKMRTRDVVRITLEAQAGGILLPGGIGGDALRVAFVIGKGAPPAIAIASVMLDRVIGLVTLAGISTILAFGMGGAHVGVRSPAAWFVASIPVGAAVAIVALRSERLRRVRVLREGRVGKLVQPILAYIAHPAAPRAIVLGLAVSVFVSAVQLGVVRGLVFALGGVPTEERWIALGTSLAFIISALPTLPGGWGTADASFVFFLGLAGIPSGVALASSLSYRLFWYLLGAMGAVIYVLRTRAQRPHSSR